ncbi:VanZ family protein [Amnibacterium sp.]|uniref:VanZ family protein n=1 Tax=Amnibacterium sp. TaxID=1872496 RepID=UPI003F7B3940
MISTFLAGARWLPIAALVAFAVVGPLAGAALSRRPRAAAALLALSIAAVLGLTLTPGGDPAPAIRCAVGLPSLSFTSVESLSNVLLLAPSALVAGVLLRRPVVAAAGAVALSVVIEAAQALVPAIGRACDTSDLATNAIGALLGGVLAFVALLLARQRAAVAAHPAPEPR